MGTQSQKRSPLQARQLGRDSLSEVLRQLFPLRAKPATTKLKNIFREGCVRTHPNAPATAYIKAMSKPPKPPSEEPRSEPEIIPPEQAEQGTPRTRVFVDTQRIYIGKPSPLGLILVTLIIGLLSAAMLVLLFGVFLFLLPLAVLVATGVIVAGLVRFYFRGP